MGHFEALLWVKKNRTREKCFLLQENDPGDVSWESFSVLKLKNFWILHGKEGWYKRKSREKYEAITAYIEA